MQGRDVTKELADITASLREYLTDAVEGRYGIAVSGSIGKGTNHKNSDYDYRLYYDKRREDFAVHWQKVQETINWWGERGRIIDGVWCRPIDQIEAQLDAWLSGEISTQTYDWTIWGYYLPTDIHHQRIIEDPFGVLAGWNARLDDYPAILKETIVAKYLRSLRYWREDYHYRNKIDTGDTVFAFSLATRIIHAAIQIVFEVNEKYYVGDGKNLEFIAEMSSVPDGFSDTVKAILYDPESISDLPSQRNRIIDLIYSIEQICYGVPGI